MEILRLVLFGGKVNLKDVEVVKKQAKTLAEIYFTSLDDDDLVDEAKRVYPNFRPIKNQNDRQVGERMLCDSNDEFLTEKGLAYLNALVNNSDCLDVLVEDEIVVGVLAVQHINKYCCQIEINFNRLPSEKQLDETANYWISSLAQSIQEQSYQHVFASACSRRANLIYQRIGDTEALLNLPNIVDEKWEKLTEEQKLTEAHRLKSGFYATGASCYRPYDGHKTKEQNWVYNYKKLINKE